MFIVFVDTDVCLSWTVSDSGLFQAAVAGGVGVGVGVILLAAAVAVYYKICQQQRHSSIIHSSYNMEKK